EPETPHPECSNISPVTAKHSYTRDSDTLNRTYQETLYKLDQTQKDLLNTNCREKRAKVCIQNVLRAVLGQLHDQGNRLRLLEYTMNIPVDFFKKPSHEYSDDQKQFATTSFFYNPKAYIYLRKKTFVTSSSNNAKVINKLQL
ncbi:hypothetical protein LSH36_32g14030, partial [Paralvinella palmiformis]